LASSLAEAKINHITQGEGIGRLGAMGQVLTRGLDLTPSGLANTGRNISNVISPRYTPEQTNLINAAKSPSPVLSTKYVKPFQDLQDKVNAPQNVFTPQQAEEITTPKSAPNMYSDIKTKVDKMPLWMQGERLDSLAKKADSNAGLSTAEMAEFEYLKSPKFSKGGSVKKSNLTAEFLATRKRA